MIIPMTQGIERLGMEIVAQSRAAPRRPDPVVYRVRQVDIDLTMPPEYATAEPKTALLEVLGQHDTVLITGQPGTGKTRQVYGLIRNWITTAIRRRGLMDMGAEVEHELIPGSQGRQWRIVSQEAWAERVVQQMAALAPFRIISESSDIRAKRFDRDWLAGIVATPKWLVVDDLGCIEPDQWVREAVYEISTQRRKFNRGTIWTTNLQDAELRAAFGAAIASRLQGGALLDLDGDDWRLR